jgi:hypothetical protein
MAKDTGSEFIVKLNGIKLPPAAEAVVSQEINAAVMRALGKIDLKGDLSARIPRREWLGIWLERVRQIEGGVPRLQVEQLR